MKFAVITIVCALTASTQTYAAEPCALSYERAIAIGHAAHAADASNVFTDYDGERAAKLLAAINAHPPVTDYPAEHILVIERPDDDVVMIAIVHDGCAGHRVQTTPEGWSEMRRGAIGDAL